MNVVNLSNKSKTFLDKLILFLYCSYPIALISGNLLTNSFVILIGALYFIFYFKVNFSENKIFVLLVIFFISLIINLFFTENLNLSYPRVLKFVFIIFFILSFNHFINKDTSFDNKIFKTWMYIIIIFSFDILVEFIFGKNLLGISSYIPGRLAGLFGEELVGGYFFYGLVFLVLSYCIKNFKINNFYFVGFLSLIVFISLIIGERANFIRVSIMAFFFFFLIIDIKIVHKLLIGFVITILLFSFINTSKYYKLRFFTQVKYVFQENGLDKYLKDSEYGAHYYTAYEIYKNNKYFGVGLKNFREESKKSIYFNKEYAHTFQRSKTHPHQVHFEVLSETGLFGYSVFILFFIFSIYFSLKNYLKTKNLYQFSGMLFVLTSLIPYLPSGSFYSSFSSSIFWLNYAIMVSNFKNLDNKS